MICVFKRILDDWTLFSMIWVFMMIRWLEPPTKLKCICLPEAMQDGLIWFAPTHGILVSVCDFYSRHFFTGSKDSTTAPQAHCWSQSLWLRNLICIKAWTHTRWYVFYLDVSFQRLLYDQYRYHSAAFVLHIVTIDE